MTERAEKAIALLAGIKSGYEQIIREFPRSKAIRFYWSQIAGLDDAIALLRETHKTHSEGRALPTTGERAG